MGPDIIQDRTSHDRGVLLPSEREGKKPLVLPTLLLEGAVLATDAHDSQLPTNRCAGWNW